MTKKLRTLWSICRILPRQRRRFCSLVCSFMNKSAWSLVLCYLFHHFSSSKSCIHEQYARFWSYCVARFSGFMPSMAISKWSKSCAPSFQFHYQKSLESNSNGQPTLLILAKTSSSGQVAITSTDALATEPSPVAASSNSWQNSKQKQGLFLNTPCLSLITWLGDVPNRLARVGNAAPGASIRAGIVIGSSLTMVIMKEKMLRLRIYVKLVSSSLPMKSEVRGCGGIM